MASLQQSKNIKLFPDEKIKITEGTSVYGLMQLCAERIDILPESFIFFRVVQKHSVLLPYRKKIPNYSKGNCPLYFRVVDLNFDVEGSLMLKDLYKDLSLLNYLYHQVMFDLFSDVSTLDCNPSVLEVLVVDILKFSYQYSCHSLREAYDLYFDLFDTRVQLKNYLSFEKFDCLRSNVDCYSEIVCLVHIVSVYAKKLYLNLGVVKRIYNVKIPIKSPGVNKGKPVEKKFLVEVTRVHVSALSDDKQSETMLYYDKIRYITIQDKTSASILYIGPSQSEPIFLSFKNTKGLESFVALVDYYCSIPSPSKLLITKFSDIKIDESSVQYVPDFNYNLICRNPHVSHFLDPEDAKKGLQRVLNRSGSYTIISNGNSLCLLYAIQDKIQPKAILCRDGLYQIAGNEVHKFNDIRDLVVALKPKICEKRVNLTNHISDSLLIDVLTAENFHFNIPPMLVDISRPFVHGSWIYKVYNGHFEDLSGNKTQCKCIEFSELVNRKAVLELSTILQKVTSESIVKYIGLCKIGRTSKVYAFVNYSNSMVYLDKYLLEERQHISTGGINYIVLMIIKQIAAALRKLHDLKIEHGCPAPHHILIDPSSCISAYEPLDMKINLKITDIGLTKMMFLKDPSENPFCQRPICEKIPSELRWLPANFLMHPSSSLSFSISLDRWVFGCTIWQIFNNGNVPLNDHSNEALLNRYLEIKDQENSLNSLQSSNVPAQGLRWFPLQMDIPKQNTMKLNKMIQKLVNYTLSDYQADQEDAFEEIADLYNNDIFPVGKEIDIYERCDQDTDISIGRNSEGKLQFKKQKIRNISLPSSYYHASALKSTWDTDMNDVHLICSDYSESLHSSLEDECDECDPAECSPGYYMSSEDCSPGYYKTTEKYDNHTSGLFCIDEVAEITHEQECSLLAQLHEFNNKNWDSSYYTLGETVGAGNFGTVRKAIVENSPMIPPDLRGREVAVKILKTAIETTKEAQNMLKLEHSRIVPLYGISYTNLSKEVHIIMPFYHLGSLKSYITQYYNEVQKHRLISFGLQIAEGMEYLSSKGFVHRDLALRNILVDNHTKVRIADLGLTRGVDKNYYYLTNKSIRAGLPTLWYPPEFFSGNKFKYDKYCDVWSYAVTMFEMWSRGETPYLAHNIKKHEELIEFLKHRTLDIPPDTPPVFEHVMKKCWLKKRERWDFKDIVTHIKSVYYINPSERIRHVPEKAGSEDGESIFTIKKLADGKLSLQTVPVKEMAALKILNPFNFTEASKDIENRDPEIPYDKLTVRRYTLSHSEEYVRRILQLKHRYMMQWVGYVYCDGVLYTAAPTHSKGTLYDYCANTRADNFSMKCGYAGQILEGMLYLLSQNIVHGSLSVHNVWLRTSNCVALSDTGIEQTPQLEQVNSRSAITYPLEVLEGLLEGREVKLDNRSDTWMFGVMLIEMFSPEPPYSEARPDKPEDSPGYMREYCEGISRYLRSTSPASIAHVFWPAEVKNALSLCFMENRTNLSALKPCFQV